MTNIIKVVAAALILTSCAKENNYKIDGSAEGIKDGTKVFLQEISEQNQLVNIDTSAVKTVNSPLTRQKWKILTSTSLP